MAILEMGCQPGKRGICLRDAASLIEINPGCCVRDIDSYWCKNPVLSRHGDQRDRRRITLEVELIRADFIVIQEETRAGGKRSPRPSRSLFGQLLLLGFAQFKRWLFLGQQLIL